jgi:hypothetical protein
MDNPKLRLTPDSLVSLLGFLAFVLVAGLGAWIFVFWQIVPWLREGAWYSYPFATYVGVDTRWIGPQVIIDWLLALPLTLVLVFLGVSLFWGFGWVSTKMYQCAARHAGRRPTPGQSRA